jgi:hypothetical protein
LKETFIKKNNLDILNINDIFDKSTDILTFPEIQKFSQLLIPILIDCWLEYFHHEQVNFVK